MINTANKMKFNDSIWDKLLIFAGKNKIWKSSMWMRPILQTGG